jgi:hypothetical protein
MRRKLKKLQKIIGFINLFTAFLILVFLIAYSFDDLKNAKLLSVISCTVLMASGVLNLIYWFIWERLNSGN